MKDFVNYEQAVALKEIGFDPFSREDMLAYFNTSNSNLDLETKDWWHKRENDFSYALSAPLKSQVFRWFRENKRMESWIYTSDSLEFYFSILKECRYISNSTDYLTYEEAEDACIDKLIEIFKTK